jgi:hypothetical protein
MIIALIHWKIRKGMEREFLSDWKTKFSINNRDGLSGEFLSEVKSNKELPYITWPVACDYAHNADDCTHYINAAFCKSPERFHAEVAKNFNDERPPLPYEIERRKRVVIVPKEWRVGPEPLPSSDTSGTI